MRVEDSNWMQIEEYLKHDDRAVIPLGCTEQHAYLSLSTDSILAYRVAAEAAEPLGVPVFPPLAYGITPYFLAYPGTVSLRVETYLTVVRDMLDSLAGQGFRRVVFVNGHGGNTPADSLIGEWMVANPTVRVAMHNWWNAPHTIEAVRAADPVASHASWMENFPWNRVAEAPEGQKEPIDFSRMRVFPPRGIREMLGDGNFGGVYEKPDEVMLKIWQIGVEETREVIERI
jgi:creatinine amidohydrolase